MSFYDDDDNDDDFNDQGQSDLVSNLRRANRANTKMIKELTEAKDAAEKTVSELTGKVNATTVAELLKAKGVNPGVSKFLKDIDPSEESINAWLAENGKLIGYDPSKGSSEGEEGAPAEEVTSDPTLSPEMAALAASMAGVQKQEGNAAPGSLPGDKSLDKMETLDKNATSFEDVAKGLRELGVIR